MSEWFGAVRRWLPGVLLIVLMGCGGPAVEQEAVARAVFWPSPPDPPRFLHEATLRSSQDVGGSAAGKELESLITGKKDKVSGLIKPLRVAAAKGVIYVTDTIADRVAVFDIPNRRFFWMGYRFEGKLHRPAGIAVSSQGNVYVTDAGSQAVVEYDTIGLFQRFLGKEAGMTRPTGVAASPDGELVYVTDIGLARGDNHKLYIFNQKDGSLVRSVGEKGRENGQFYLPSDVAVSPVDGKVYVLDAGNFRVQVFDREGKFLSTWGKLGRGLGQLARPRGIAVDHSDNIYVTDGAFANIQVFNPKGELLLPLGDRAMEDGPGKLALPSGVATDETGRVYVVDQYFSKVEVLRRLSEEEGAQLLATQPAVADKPKAAGSAGGDGE